MNELQRIEQLAQTRPSEQPQYAPKEYDYLDYQENERRLQELTSQSSNLMKYWHTLNQGGGEMGGGTQAPSAMQPTQLNVPEPTPSQPFAQNPSMQINFANDQFDNSGISYPGNDAGGLGGGNQGLPGGL